MMQCVKPKWIVGIDEVGTGAFAGPIAIGCAIVAADWVPHPSVRDSKKFEGNDGRVRYEKRYLVLKKHIVTDARAVFVVCEVALPGESLGDAWQRLVEKTLMRAADILGADAKNAVCVIDGASRKLAKQPFAVTFVVKADALVPAVSAASIAAKVERDGVMLALHALKPHMGYSRHMGYGTAEHKRALLEHGLQAEHREFVASLLPKLKIAANHESAYVQPVRYARKRFRR